MNQALVAHRLLGGPQAEMRIALLITQLEPGGAQRVAIDIADGLRARGHEVELWFFYRKLDAYTNATGVRVLLPARPRGLRSLVALWGALRTAFDRFRPEATIGFTHYANVIGLAAAAVWGISRRVASQQNPVWSYPRVARWTDRLCGALGIYTANIAVSRAVLESFASYPEAYRRRARVVPNGSPVRVTALSREDARRQFGIPSEEFMVLAVGRLHPQKNHAVLLQALTYAPSVHLSIAGDGELRESLERLAAEHRVRDRVRFLGAVPGDSIPALLRAADVFAMPSRFEGLSLALLEALAARLPIVSSRIPPQTEVLTNATGHECAVLLDCEDAQAWGAALTELREHEDLRRILAQAAGMRAMDFSLDATVRGYEAALVR